MLLLTGAYPIYRLWRGTEGQSLRQAVVWAIVAWLTVCGAWWTGGSLEWRYLALCLTACAGVAVLGARRPGVGAWNFVVVGLFVVLCRPLLQGLGELKLEPIHLVFLGVSLAVGVGNYLPTRQILTSLWLGGWLAVEIAILADYPIHLPTGVLPLALAVVPWMALGARRKEEDLWLSFRDGFGFLWAQRMREQFTRAAANGGLSVKLSWQGLRGHDLDRGRELLRSLLRRFLEDAPK